MKNWLFLLILSGLYACNGLDELEKLPHTLDGSWHLHSFSCQWPNIELEPGQYTWTFKLKRNQLKVSNQLSSPAHNLWDTDTFRKVKVQEDQLIIDSSPFRYQVQGTTLLVYYDHYISPDGNDILCNTFKTLRFVKEE